MGRHEVNGEWGLLSASLLKATLYGRGLEVIGLLVKKNP
jgi:hypothetical protein